ncbi:MAG TPA: GNAT family N-acetyltransferase [Bryobacteraceae bacterium]|nr:GNAT family N-acetyltransferase [Bryobacteraceae bacterium]
MTQPEHSLSIREFQAGDEAAFYRLNEEWITQFFSTLEPLDLAYLEDPQHKILERGGRIFLATLEGQAVGCCALVPIAPWEFEVAKMGVTGQLRGSGIGRRLLERIVAEARAMGARRLYIETNRTLGPAIHLYESIGFRHLPPERIAPSPYARANVFLEMFLDN